MDDPDYNCSATECQRALDDYLNGEALKQAPPQTPVFVCWEHQADREPIRLSFSIKVF